ncbi:MAG: hypothetical protein ACFB2X_27595 [Rivularia sp. (in: cyanobacteria)]
MPNVLILPHYHYENEFANFLNEVNVTQADFKFYLLPPENTIESPITKPMADYCEILDYLNNQKKRMNLNRDDLLLAFYDGVITASDRGLTNLFIAGANTEDPYPCTAVVSLRFISWGILEQKYDYSLQRHALFHLAICALIGAYTKVHAHYQTYGCLLDFNNQLVDFNRKLQMGYYLCSTSESGCYNAVKSARYGKSIIKLCTVLREGIDRKKLQIIIQEFIMGNKGDTNYINHGSVAAMGHKAKADNTNIYNLEQHKQTLSEAAAEIQKLLRQLEQNNPTATEPEKVDYINDETSRSFKRRVTGALQASSETAIDEFILENKYLKVAKAAIKGWLQPGS